MSFLCMNSITFEERIEMRVLVLGASGNPERYSNRAIKLLRHYKYDVFAVGQRTDRVLDVDILTGTPDVKNIDTLTLYIGPRNQPLFYDYIKQIHPRRVIFNPGTENQELMEMCEKNGIECEVACTLVLLNTGQF